MRCLVTGATGFLGSFLIRLLLSERQTEVAILIRPTGDPWRIFDIVPNVQVIRGDLAHISALAREIKTFGPEVVFHLGWDGVASLRRDDPEQIISNVPGSLQLVRVAAEAGCRRWVGLGSQAEFGPHDGVLNTDVPTNPVTAYGVAKLCVGLLTRQLCAAYQLDHCWLRLLAAYGPMDDPSHLIPYVILKLLSGEKPSLTNGGQRWDYLYVRDVSDAILRAGTSKSMAGAFVLGSGEAPTVRWIAEQIRELVDPQLPIGMGDMPDRKDQPMNLQADSECFRAATGWKPAVSLTEGLERTVAWFKQNQERYRA